MEKNILYLKRCGYVFGILVVDKTYVIDLLGLLIPSWIQFIYIYIYIYIYVYITQKFLNDYRDLVTHIYLLYPIGKAVVRKRWGDYMLGAKVLTKSQIE